ncbi:signal transduction histidine kinase [Arthrobacter stackebrandtii]|uniref:histidine kinase n=1 Tax=Arthrobacter stackebrandtii TaxID=272161 RepID=A0ABS4YSC0_9MICC|nr:histidine kinase [Arthrobacter stackebrandtii]MBP2411683.1 signal transduction histidine kinase [Arthrobacter stackebrandtii]
MDESTPPAGTGHAGTAPPPAATPPLRRLGAAFMGMAVRRLGNTKVEDVALAVGYFLLFWLLDAVNFAAFGNLKVEALASAWPAIALLGCVGVVFRRTAPAAMAWMCGLAAVGLLLAGHAGCFVLMFEFFFSLVLFGSPRAAALASRAAWVVTAVLVVAAFASFRDAGLTVVAGLLGVITFLTPVEWAGNLRKAILLAESESARADAVHEAAAQRLLAERNAHDLSLEQERQHMARELHDVISARLSAIALQSGAALHAAKAAPAGSPGTALLRQIRQESVAGLEELNAMIRLLHSGAASEAPGRIAELEPLVGRHRSAGLELSFSNGMPDGGRHLPLPVQTTVYRVAAESLANAARHAPGQPVAVSLAAVRKDEAGTPQQQPATPAQSQDRTPSPPPAMELVLTVSSELPAHQPAASPGTGTGIPSMQFRAAHAGGTLTAGPESGQWKVLLRLPLPGPAPQAPAGTVNTNEGLHA